MTIDEVVGTLNANKEKLLEKNGKTGGISPAN